MKQLLNALIIAFLNIQSATAQRDSRPCGLKIAPCQEDQECIPDHPDCTDINRCLGHCKWENTYPDCGGYRRIPKHCDETAHCEDDPREPESCGMTCDIPGICIPNGAPSCEGDGSCPEGLWCYEMVRHTEGGYPYKSSVCL